MDILTRPIWLILSQSDAECGNYSKVVTLPDGSTMTHHFSWATAMGADFKAHEYRKRFGLLPAWVLTFHPFKQSRLCSLAMKHDMRLPDEMPPRPWLSEEDIKAAEPSWFPISSDPAEDARLREVAAQLRKEADALFEKCIAEAESRHSITTPAETSDFGDQK